MEASHYVAVLHLEIEEIWVKCTPTLFYSIKGSIKEEKLQAGEGKVPSRYDMASHTNSHLFALRPRVKILHPGPSSALPYT